jgi:hypothetical protein
MVRGCFLLWLVVCMGVPRAVHSYSTGAGACPAGGAAVGGYHLATVTGTNTSRIVRRGPLSEGEFVVSLGDAVLSPVNATSTNATAVFRINQEYEIAVFSNRYEYKGILIRFEFMGAATIDVGEALIPDVNTQIAVACFGASSNVIGITHFNNTFKTLHSGRVQVPQTGPVALDITVVGLNNATASLYGYDRFLVQFAEKEVPVAVPTPTTAQPISVVPSRAPVAGPTAILPAAPISGAPSGAPTAIPARQKNTTGLAAVAVEQEVVQSIALTLLVVKELSEPEVRAWERATMAWFQEFYNDTAIDRSNARGRRNLQTIYNNYGVVLGSMETLINVTNVTYPPGYELGSTSNSSSSTNTTTPMNITLIYDQILSYRAIVNASYPGPMQYVTLPFRSRVGRRTYVEQLRRHLYAFSQLSTESLAIPILQGPPVTTLSGAESPTDSMAEDDGLSVGAMVGIVLAVVVVVVAAALYAAWHMRATQKPAETASARRPVGQVEFDAETFRFDAADKLSHRRPPNGGADHPPRYVVGFRCVCSVPLSLNVSALSFHVSVKWPKMNTLSTPPRGDWALSWMRGIPRRIPPTTVRSYV